MIPRCEAVGVGGQALSYTLYTCEATKIAELTSRRSILVGVDWLTLSFYFNAVDVL